MDRVVRTGLMCLWMCGCGQLGSLSKIDPVSDLPLPEDSGAIDTDLSDTSTSGLTDTDTDLVDSESGGVVDDPLDTDVTDTTLPDIDTSDGVGDSDTGTVPQPGSLASDQCIRPISYERIGHSGGDLDFYSVEYAPDGTYALIIGYPARLYRFDTGTKTLSDVSSVTGEQWNAIEFSDGGEFALIGGGTTGDDIEPVLYKYTETEGLIGAETTGLFATMRIQDIARKPDGPSFLLLSDNGEYTGVAYTHLYEWDGESVPNVMYYGGVPIQQGASSMAWGTNLGQQIALGVSRYLELLYLDPSLSSGILSLQSHGNVGNLKKVVFNPEGTVAWVLQWSGSGRLYPWEGSLDTNGTFGFSGWSMWDFSVASDGHWKIFVGRFGNVWLSDSPWNPIVNTRFYNDPIENFDSAPWSGDSNTYLHEAAWKPNSCEGLIVGDSTQSQGLLVHFELTQPN